MNSKLTTGLRGEGRGASSTEQCLRSAGLCPSLAGRQGYHNTCLQGTSYTLRQLVHRQAGVLSRAPNEIIWVPHDSEKSSCFQQRCRQTDPGASHCRGLFKIFLPPAACPALLHKVTLAVAGRQKCVLHFSTGATCVPSPTVISRA